MLRKKQFEFPASCSIREIVIRETNGHDEERAAAYAEAKGGKSSTYAELIRTSIISVDGEKVTQPFSAMDEWNSKTRALVIKAFQQLNDLPEKEIADFLEGSKEVTEGESAPRAEKLQSVKV